MACEKRGGRLVKSSRGFVCRRGGGETIWAFAIVSSLLFLFFVLPPVHSWANSLTTKLHFCNHLACFIYSIIWLALAVVGWKHVSDGKKPRNSLIAVSAVVLIVGIILMNIVYCDASGRMTFGRQTPVEYTVVDTQPMSGPVPTPPCVDTDAGRDYITRGMIRSGADIEDLCMGDNILRERYCDSMVTYTSVDIRCSGEYGSGWGCEEGECRLLPVTSTTSTTPTSTTTTAITSSTPITTTLAEDCQHGSIFPVCGGSCPTPNQECSPMVTQDGSGNYGWCECMPATQTPCGESAPTGSLSCGGWCLDSMYCLQDYNLQACYCSDFPCVDSDGFGVETPGTCIGLDGEGYYDACASSNLIEYYCSSSGCVTTEVDCSTLYGGAGYECAHTKDGAYCSPPGVV